MTVRIRRPYLDWHDLWRGVYWHREGAGVRVYWCPGPVPLRLLAPVVIRVDIRTRR